MQTTLSTATASWFLSRLLRTSGVGQRKRLSAHDYKSRSLVVCRSSQVTSRHRPCPLHCIPTRVPAPVLLAPTTVVLPHVPRPGFSPRHYTTRHTRLHFKRLRGSPTSTCKSSPRIPPICIWATHAVPFLPAPASRLPCDSQSSMHAHRRAPLD